MDSNKQLAINFGVLLKEYRTREPNSKTLDELAVALDDLNHQKYKDIDKSRIQRWERGFRGRPPSRDIVIDIANALNLTPEQRDTLLVTAGYASMEGKQLVGALHEISSDTKEIRKQVNSIAAFLNPVSPPIVPGSAMGIAAASVQKAGFPSLYFGLAAFLLNTFNIEGSAALLVYAGLGLGIVLTQGLLRFRRLIKTVREEGLADKEQGYRYGELLFISMFVMFSAPLLQSTITGMDSYGFFTNPRFAGSVLPLLLALAVNMVISLIAVALFQFLWLWQYRKMTGTAYARALKILIPTLLVAYVPVAIFTGVGSETYYLCVVALLFAAFMVVVSFSDPEVKLGEWEAKVAFASSIGVMCVLFIVAIVGMLVNYTGSQTPSYGNHLWKWAIDYSALGYPQAEVAERMRIGYIWTMFAGIAYMLFVVGSNLLVTIYRNQVKPSKGKQ